ncbi:MAG: SpoIIE family protein phosphatase [Verrucomicrobia bacterium]|nr:SpoIIE family protein phosphatase [Verrucomicrobiota bacterium]
MNHAEQQPASPTPPELGFWEWDFTKDSMVWDEGMHALFGMTPGTFDGASDDFLNRVHNGDRAHVASMMAVAVERGMEYEGEFRIQWVDGSIHSVLMRGIVYRESSGKAFGMGGTCQPAINEDFSGLTASMERTMFAALMESLPDCIYFKDMDSRLIAVNQAMVRWHGVSSPQTLLGKTDFDLFLDEHANQALEDEREILDTGLPLVNIEEKEMWPDGHVTYVSTSKMPLRDERGRIIGTFGLSRDITERKNAQHQLAQIAEELRHKNEALEEELAMARELQLAMLPQSFPTFFHAGREAARFYHFFQPSTAVSGDFFDVYAISPDRVGIFICDVMGHGVRASLVVATIRALVDEMASNALGPEVLMGDLNSALRRILRHNSTPLFVSGCYLVADLAAGELVYANAGHPRPMQVRAGGVLPLEGKTGPVLGLFDETTYERCVCRFEPQDTVLFFTDGLFEVENAKDEIYDYSRLLHAVESRRHLPMKELCRGVVEEVQAFATNREFSDDVCLVGMELA